MNKRQTKILELLTQNKKVEVTKLSELLGVSQVTIRKDLDALSESGMLIREHGYATLNKSDDMNIRLAYHFEQKQKVAKKAVESIQHGETIMLESGSCCALVALEIAKTKKDVTLITNSAFIADYIRKQTAINMAINTLSYSEIKAVSAILNELDGLEGRLTASVIADRIGITRSVIVNALRKLESAGIIESRSLGMKGTYLKVLNEGIYDKLKEYE